MGHNYIGEAVLLVRVQEGQVRRGAADRRTEETKNRIGSTKHIGHNIVSHDMI